MLTWPCSHTRGAILTQRPDNQLVASRPYHSTVSSGGPRSMGWAYGDCVGACTRLWGNNTVLGCSPSVNGSEGSWNGQSSHTEPKGTGLTSEALPVRYHGQDGFPGCRTGSRARKLAA